MATPPRDPKETAMRSRIISHMNKDHQDSLVHYLRHHYDLSPEQTSNANLIDINLKQIVLTAGGQCYTLPIIPPMTSFSEARARLVSMDHEAREALGLPPPPSHDAIAANGNASHKPSSPSGSVTRYVPPSGFHLVVFVAALTSYVVFARAENVRPGGIAYDYGLRYAPQGVVALAQRVQFWWFSGLVGAHAIETVVMGGKLRREGVPVGSSLWWSWTASCFVDGFCSLQRLERLVKRSKREGSGKEVK